MYRGCQLCFLPTLLEVFSASTLEAMNFRLPVVATDFDFNSEVMGDSCLYYEPMNAKDAAKQIKKYVESESLREEMKQKMDERLKLFGDYDKHFNEILDFLKEVAGKRKN
jgi:glycosyltransferase involved in cell wall biosynthesis